MSTQTVSRFAAAAAAIGIVFTAPAASLAHGSAKFGKWQKSGPAYNVKNTKTTKSACQNYVKKVRDPKTGRMTLKRFKACARYTN